VAFELIYIVQMPSSVGSSDDEKHGDHENDADIELGKLSKEVKLCWVRGTISKTVLQYMGWFRQKQMSLIEGTTLGCEDAAKSMSERDMKYGNTELRVRQSLNYKWKILQPHLH